MSRLAVLAACVLAPVSAPADPERLPFPSEGKPFEAAFTILFRADDPQLALRPAQLPGVSFNVPTWRVEESEDNWAAVHDEANAGDGFDPSILTGDTRQRTPNLFSAGERRELRATSAEADSNGALELSFPGDPAVALRAVLHPAGPDGFPVLEVTATRRKAGWLSVGYTGAPSASEDETQAAWQPMLWTERRFPNRPYLTPASLSPLPTTLLQVDGRVVGVLADPVELPFQPLPQFSNARFGTALRTPDARLSPMLFFPMLGGPGSYGEVGESTTFRLRLVALDGDVPSAFETLARRVYGFADRRHNALGTMNEALDRVLDYAMSEYAWWVPELRGNAYATDVPDAVKNVSSLSPMAFALVKDEPAYFEERAKPILEYLWSREKFLFTLDPEQRIQSPSRAMLGPSAPLTEMTAWHALAAGTTDAFLAQAENLWGRTRVLNLDAAVREDNWWNALAIHRATGDPAWLARAREKADAYLARRVDTPATRFDDPDSIGFFFWNGFVPRWVDLLLLYEATGEPRYLAAAHHGARLSTLFLFVCPSVPEGDIVVNEGGVAPLYWYLGSRGFKAIPIAEESAPAWRLSEIGLGPESSGTAHGHRSIFMANYAPWYLRLAALTGDDFLRELARWALVGRSRNFPGYHMNTARTTVYEQADYPRRPHHELSYNSIHYNHIWPYASILLDYLVSDAWSRSGGAIDFPGEYIEGYAYLQSRLHGHRPGRVYGLKDVNLWMPTGLVRTGSPELDHLSGYDADGLVIVLMNQSAEAVSTRVTLDPSRLEQTPVAGAAVRRWIGGVPVSDSRWGAEGVAIDVPASGLAVLHVAAVRPDLRFAPASNSSPAMHGAERVVGPGDARGAILSAGGQRSWAYVYLREDDARWRSVTLHVDRADAPSVLVDDAYPFEFSVPLAPGEIRLPVRLEALDRDGRTHAGAAVILGDTPTP